MYDIERQNRILELLNQNKNKALSVTELANAVYASAATIRRDLSKMEQKGLVVRTFGAVTLNPAPINKETSFEFRESSNVVQKRALCKKAAAFIRDNSSIFIDSSSTLLNIVPYLGTLNKVTILTNGLFLASRIIAETNHEVILCGGTVAPNTNSIAGTLAVSNLLRFHPDYCLLSTAAIDLNSGIMENTVETAEIKRIMLAQCHQSICVVDDSKFGKQALFQAAPLESVDILISDHEFSEDEKKILEKKHTQIA